MRIDMTHPDSAKRDNTPVTIVTDTSLIDVFPNGTVQRYVRRPEDGLLTGEAYEFHHDNSLARLG